MVDDEAKVGLMKINSLLRENGGGGGWEGMFVSELTKHVQQKQEELVG